MMWTMSKSKRIKSAAKELKSALKRHAEIVADGAVSMKKAQRAAARLASAAQVYAEAVHAKTGLGDPFADGGGRLDDASKDSLRAERDEIYKAVTAGIPVVAAEAAAEPAGSEGPRHAAPGEPDYVEETAVEPPAEESAPAGNA